LLGAMLGIGALGIALSGCWLTSLSYVAAMLDRADRLYVCCARPTYEGYWLVAFSATVLFSGSQ